ncbi:hypothetical protein H5410_043194 [Solanum commersonii]|uniref:Uncharacterized protein n=1 Tax=Solanum commersonii TaxID=4109 RepID=A0A9J5XZK8_SOLCO|nr:hypothetical protein H5410_043194 [Solanum commersonii]
MKMSVVMIMNMNLVDQEGERITEQLNIRVFKLQEMIRKKLKLHVGKTTVRRARAKGMSVAITNVLPKCEHRMCARNILANRAKDLRGFQRRQQFWKIAKSTIESQLRNNIENMKLLGPEKMIDNLMYYNINFWCKVYFNIEVKCDSVDNNMSECFNAWILAARHKTIITMLEEIKVKMMTRIAKLREFQITWKCNFSPMALKVLEENISRSMDCTIEFNGAVGFEVKKGLWQHKVDIARRTCSCRKFSLYDYIDSCYSKETYLRIYANVIEPLTNMEMWPVSINPTIEPPEITNMPEIWKLPRTGLAMTYNICHVRGHNKRGCPQREGVESSTRQSAPSPTASVRAEPTGSGRGRGKPKGREDHKKTSSVAPSAPSLPTDFSASSSASPTYHASSSIAGTTKRGRGRGRGNTSLEKRPRVMGMSVFQSANGFKVMNPGMPSSKTYSTGQAKVTRSSNVTSEIGYTPSNITKLKWNGKATISTSKLHELREKQRKKTMGSSSSQNDTSSQSKMPCVLTYVVLVMCFTNGVVLSMLKYE